MEDFDLLQLLPYIDPDDYEVWYKVGMALKKEGYSVQDWDDWSRGSSKYHPGECESKWNSFNGSVFGEVTGATITMYAKEGGWESSRQSVDNSDLFLAWDAVIGTDKPSKKIIDEGFLEKEALDEPKVWKPCEQLIEYLNALFQPDDIIGYCVQSRKQPDKDKWVPANAGVYGRTAGDIIEDLRKSDDISDAIGSYESEAGAWIRINPLDGKGVLNANVTEYRYTLVESDDMDLEKQYALIKQLELPVAALVHSGKKSIHAVVKVNALDMNDYQKKVQYLYSKCKVYGLNIDTKNKNPSRLSRMPGVFRGDKKQYLIATNIGKVNWEDWVEYVETELDSDPLPDPINISDMAKNPPQLAPELIEGILRVGHKMMITAASKSGKTHLAFMLALSICTGQQWLKWKCKQGRVLYIDGEMDSGDFYNRLSRLATATGYDLTQTNNLDIYLCRGKKMKLETLAKQLVFKFGKLGKGYYSAIIIDPIYAFGMTDENSAEVVIDFLMNVDVIAETLGSSVIYIHHHSKGAQDAKRAGDRGSGSGVFTRHADAVIDMMDLQIPAEVRQQLFSEEYSAQLLLYFDKIGRTIPEPEKVSYEMIERYAQTWEEKADIRKLENASRDKVETYGGRRIETVLRSFPSHDPFNIWFKSPVFEIDESGLLDDTKAVGSQANGYAQGGEAAKSQAKRDLDNELLRMKRCFDKLEAEKGEVTRVALMEAYNKDRAKNGESEVSKTTFDRKLAKSDDLEVIRYAGSGKKEASLIRRKEQLDENLHEDFPEGI